MRIGVVVPTYNRERLVLETLESVAAQTRPADRVVVADDCSTDNSVARVREWMAGRNGPTDWLVVRQEKNGGVSAARNLGAGYAQDCDLLAFLDSDDLWPERFIENVMTTAEREPNAVAFVSDRQIEDSFRDRKPWLQKFDWIAERTVPRLVRRGCPGPSCVVVRRRALEAIGGWDEAVPYMEDFGTLADISVLGPLVHVRDTTVRYRLGVGETRGEQASISHSHTDRGLHRALALERFLSAHDVPGMANERAFCWYRAARTAYRNRNWIECEQRATRAMRIAPWYGRPAVLWLRARTRRLFGSRATATTRIT